MCVSFCRRRGWLYWNHVDCEPASCDLAQADYDPCAICRHRLPAGQCGLTRAPLPAGEQGCCHFDCDLPAPDEPVEVARATLRLLHIGPQETEEAVLRREDVPYERDVAGKLWVTPERLPLPYTWGQGTDDHLPEEKIDWSGWFEQW